MVTKQGTWKAKIPTQYKTKNKNVSIDRDQKKKCPVCGKANKLIVHAKPQYINEHDPNMYHVSKCLNCKYIHLVLVAQEEENNDHY